MFVNRERELDFLEGRFASSEAELIVLFGRRRVGKTDLLAKFCEDKRHIFFVADLDVEPVLRARLSAAVNTRLLGSETASAVYPSWDALLQVIARHARDEPLVVVLDEFTYLLGAHPPLASVLQRLWDSDLRHTQLKLVLCGSHIGMMESEVLGYQAPLYGRRTAQYLLDPLTFADTTSFFAHLDAADRVQAYAVLGGTPAYLRLIEPGQTIEVLIVDKILTRGTFLYDEVRLLLQQELREPRNYFAVLEAIAGGRTRLNEIKQATGLEGISSYLSTLIALQIVERIVPVTESQPHKSRRGLYRLRDPFFRFWLRFVHPNRSALEQGGAQTVYDTHVAPQLDTFTGPVFEQVCEQYLWRASMAGTLSLQPQRIGGWWAAKQEVDLIALADGQALVGECKWSSRPIGVDILRHLESVAAGIPELADRTISYALFARSGFTDQVTAEAGARDDLMLVDLATLTAT